MGCSPSSERNIIIEYEEKKMLQNEIKIKKDPWSLDDTPIIEYDPWEGDTRDSNSDSVNSNKSVKILSVSPSPSSQAENVSIVDLRAKSDVINASQQLQVVHKTSSCQTDHPDGVDFDWDLTDKTDTETQTSPPSRADSLDTEPLDVIVQTDQRIVFHSGKRVTFNLDESESAAKKSIYSQTVWEVDHKETQVETSELGDDDWSLSRTFESSFLDSGLSVDISLAASSISPHVLDDDIGEPLAFVHNASVLSKRSFKRQEKSRDIAIQTNAYRDFLQGSHSESQPDTKVDFLGDDPFFFEECDEHVLVVSRKWYKSLKKLVKHLSSIVDNVQSYKERRDLICVRAFFVWICNNLRSVRSLKVLI